MIQCSQQARRLAPVGLHLSASMSMQTGPVGQTRCQLTPWSRAKCRTHKGRGIQDMVLVVDDEHIIANTLSMILNTSGSEALAVCSGGALQGFGSFEPDVVIRDVVMAEISGIETAIALRTQRPDCKILLFSGQAATTDLLRHAREQGRRFEIMAKPVHPSDLLAKLRMGSVAANSASRFFDSTFFMTSSECKRRLPSQTAIVRLGKKEKRNMPETNTSALMICDFSGGDWRSGIRQNRCPARRSCAGGCTESRNADCLQQSGLPARLHGHFAGIGEPTQMVEAHVPLKAAQERLRHSRPDILLKFHAHVLDASADRAAETLSGRLSGSLTAA